MRLAAIKEDFFFSIRHPWVRASIIGFVVSASLGLIVGMAYWWPIMHSAHRLQIQIDERRREISSADFNAKLAQAAANSALQIELIEKELDTSVTQAVLVQNMAALARLSNVKIVSEAYAEGKAKDGYSPLVHELTVQAGYPELRSFIAGIQQLPSFTIVQEAVLSRSSNSTSIKVQLNIVTYRRALRPKT